METVTIDQHTFVPSLLRYNGWVIDAGARGFNFSKELLALGCRPYAIDIENFSEVPKGVIFKHAALTNYTGQTECYMWGNGYGNFIRGINETPGNTEDRPCETKIVTTITLEDIYKEIGSNIDLLKLDIEGSEYLVLENFEPIPKQITVEFHEHAHKVIHDIYFNNIFAKLCKDYHCNLYIREWPQYKFMDCLFIRKDIL